MKFITYNDSPSGIYKSQVIDVCRFMQTTFGISVELVAFVSLRTFFKDRKKIKKMYKNSTILPEFPGIDNWRKNIYILNFFMLFNKPDNAITRGVFATLLALTCKKINSICFDPRSACAAEWKEYLSAESPTIADEMKAMEQKALLRTNFRIAVSTQLVNYWKEQYGYAENAHVIIPCTIKSDLVQKSIEQTPCEREISITGLRKQWGINDTDVLLAFSGSSAGWQSMKYLYQILHGAFMENASLKLLLLSKDTAGSELSKDFPGRVVTAWVEPEKVSDYLKAADYGLLYREDSITNRVSSPVKFGEYLAAGLPVIISKNVGDYSSFVENKKCGLLFNSVNWGSLKRPSQEEKARIQEIAFTYFTKSAYTAMYKQVVEMK